MTKIYKVMIYEFDGADSGSLWALFSSRLKAEEFVAIAQANRVEQIKQDKAHEDWRIKMVTACPEPDSGHHSLSIPRGTPNGFALRKKAMEKLWEKVWETREAYIKANPPPLRETWEFDLTDSTLSIEEEELDPVLELIKPKRSPILNTKEPNENPYA